VCGSESVSECEGVSECESVSECEREERKERREKDREGERDGGRERREGEYVSVNMFHESCAKRSSAINKLLELKSHSLFLCLFPLSFFLQSSYLSVN
jgi:hypothetical protein